VEQPNFFDVLEKLKNTIEETKDPKQALDLQKHMVDLMIQYLEGLSSQPKD